MAHLELNLVDAQTKHTCLCPSSSVSARSRLAPGRRAVPHHQLVEQRFGLHQIPRVEAFGEPTIDWSEKILGLLSFALIAPQPRHAHSRTQFPGLCLLLTSDRQRMFEIFFRFRCVWSGNNSAI